MQLYTSGGPTGNLEQLAVTVSPFCVRNKILWNIIYREKLIYLFSPDYKLYENIMYCLF